MCAGESFTYRSNSLTRCGKNAKRRQSSSVDYHIAIDKNFIFAITPMFRIDLDL